MIIKRIIDEDFNNYKTCSMLIAFPTCTWKCGASLCQNSPLATSPNIEISFEEIVERYIENALSSAMICGGLEPFDSFDDVCDLICTLRERCSDPVIIYTGYTEKEVRLKIKYLSERYDHIIVKYGRYLPNQKPHYDEVLGVELQSDNQYGKVIS